MQRIIFPLPVDFPFPAVIFSLSVMTVLFIPPVANSRCLLFTLETFVKFKFYNGCLEQMIRTKYTVFSNCLVFQAALVKWVAWALVLHVLDLCLMRPMPAYSTNKGLGWKNLQLLR